MMLKARIRWQFDPQALLRRARQTLRQWLMMTGGFVRTAARSSMKPARRKLQGEMTPEERQSFRIRQAIAKRKGRMAAMRPLAPSRPGEPPRRRTGLLRDDIKYAIDEARTSIVIGPEAKGPRTAAALEFGGAVRITVGPNRDQWRGIAPRPFMRPALVRGIAEMQAKAKGTLPALWAGSVRVT